MDTLRHEYRLKWWAQAWYLALGALFSAVGIHIIRGTISAAKWNSFKDWCGFLIPVGIIALGCYFFALALRSKVVLEATRITVRYAIRKKSADLSEIIGLQTYAKRNLSFWQRQFRGISFWYLQLRARGGYISIMQLFDVDPYFLSWLQQLPDLDRLSLSL